MIDPSQPIEPLLTTHNLCIGYAKKHAESSLLENLNLSLQPGQLVCFMGANGIGKSTLIRTLAGLQKPLSGKIFYAGNSKEELSKKLSVVLTDKIAILNMRVYELVSFGRYPYLDWTITLNAEDEWVIKKSIDEVGINHLLDRRLYELSDGQLQMAMIARALAQNNKIILLDEPTAHLDLTNRIEIMNLLRKLSHSSNKAILVATHELDLALQTADRIWLPGKNKEIDTGLPEDLILNGSFDEAFQFKGYNLKTGKFQHEAHRAISVQIVGLGEEYRWTRNALERMGFMVADKADSIITIHKDDNNTIRWLIKQKGSERSAETLKDLLAMLINDPTKF